MKRNRKNRFVIGGIAALSCVALAGVGYSTWVIAASIDSDSGNVKIYADSVDTDNLTITVGESLGSYYFTPDNDATSAGYIYAGSGSTDESLTLEFSFTISTTLDSFSKLGDTYDIYLNLSTGIYVNDEVIAIDTYGSGNPSEAIAAGTVGTQDEYYDTDALAYAVGQGYLVSPIDVATPVQIASVSPSSGVSAVSDGIETIYTSSSVSASSNGSTYQSATVTVKANFAWGAYFDHRNPVLWDGTDGSSGSSAHELADVTKALQWLNTTFANSGDNSITYTLSGSQHTGS